jgi:hypothetical protein
MAQPRFHAAADAVAAIVGVSAKEIFFEVDAAVSVVLVNWQQSMLCVGPQRDAVRNAVQDNVPAAYKSYRVSIT